MMVAQMAVYLVDLWVAYSAVKRAEMWVVLLAVW